MTDITAVDHAFGEHDMFAHHYDPETDSYQTTRQLYTVDVLLYDGAPTETGVADAYVVQGFLKIVFPDGQCIYHNVNEIKSFAVTPQ